MENIELVSLPITTVNNILNYLSTKPFSEVAQLINNIQKEAKVIDKIKNKE